MQHENGQELFSYEGRGHQEYKGILLEKLRVLCVSAVKRIPVG